MELEPLEPEAKEYDIPLDENFPETPGGKPRGKKRLWLLIPLGALAALILAICLNFNAIAAHAVPLYALVRGAGMVRSLPDPGAYGVLGTVTWRGRSMNCSGVLRAQVDGEGLHVLAEDMSLGGDLFSLEFSGYLSAHDAALTAPSLAGGSHAWYGVELDRAILDQAAGTGGDPDFGWYYDRAAIAAFQSAADLTREAMARVGKVGLSDAEAQGLQEAVRALHFTTADAGTLWRLEAAAGEEELRRLLSPLGLTGSWVEGETTLSCGLSKETGALVSVSVTGRNLEFDLNLGDDPREELTPRLTLTTLQGGEAQFSAELAFTVSPSGSVDPPHYTNAFHLLPTGDWEPGA